MPDSNDPQKPKQPKETSYLNLPPSDTPMTDRTPTAGTQQLTEASYVIFRIGTETAKLPVKGRLSIGRTMEDENVVDLDLTRFGAYQGGVSRNHAAITLHDAGLYIEDLNSTNGTRINGSQLAPSQKYRLRDGDEIEFARLRVIVKFEKA